MVLELQVIARCEARCFGEPKCYENGRTIFHVQALVKTFCKILCNDAQNAGGGIVGNLDDRFPLLNGPSISLLTSVG